MPTFLTAIDRIIRNFHMAVAATRRTVVPPSTLMKPSEPPKTFYDMTRAELKQLLTSRVQHGSYNISSNYIRTELARRDADDAAQPAPPTGRYGSQSRAQSPPSFPLLRRC